MRHVELTEGQIIRAAWWIVVILSICLIAVVDRPLASLVRANVDGGMYAFFRFVTDFGVATGWVVGALLVIAGAWVATRIAAIEEQVTRARWWARHAMLLLASLAVTGILVNASKVVIGRTRPRYQFNEDDPFYGFKMFNTDFGMNSFPSGHSHTIWNVATVLILVFPRAWPEIVAGGVLVAMSRVMVGSHYMSDVVAGSFLGIVVPLFLRRWIIEPKPPTMFPELRRRYRHPAE